MGLSRTKSIKSYTVLKLCSAQRHIHHTPCQPTTSRFLSLLAAVDPNSAPHSSSNSYLPALNSQRWLSTMAHLPPPPPAQPWGH